jgi:hypothetical protein
MRAMNQPLVAALLAVFGLSGCMHRHARAPRPPAALHPAPASMAKLRVFVDVRHAAATETNPNAPEARCGRFQFHEGPVCPPSGGQEALAQAIAAAIGKAGMAVVTDPSVDYDVHVKPELYVTNRGTCRASAPSAVDEAEREPVYCGIVTLDSAGATFTHDADRARATVLDGALTHMAEGRECRTRLGAGWPMWIVPGELEPAFDPRAMAVEIANSLSDCDALMSFTKQLPSSESAAPSPGPSPTPTQPPTRRAPLPSVAPTQT